MLLQIAEVQKRVIFQSSLWRFQRELPPLAARCISNTWSPAPSHVDRLRCVVSRCFLQKVINNNKVSYSTVALVPPMSTMDV